MKKLGGLDPFTLVMLVLVVLCAGVLGYEGLKRLQRPAPQATTLANAPAPADPSPAPPPAPEPQPAPQRGERINI